MSGWFITGTDTEIGKTRASVALVEAFKARGLEPAAMKPVASGCHRVDGELRNGDAIDLIEREGLASPIARTSALEEAAAALDAMRSHERAPGEVVLPS